MKSVSNYIIDGIVFLFATIVFSVLQICCLYKYTNTNIHTNTFLILINCLRISYQKLQRMHEIFFDIRRLEVLSV